MSKILENKIAVAGIFFVLGCIAIFLIGEITKEFNHPMKKVAAVHTEISPTPTISTVQPSPPADKIAFTEKENTLYLRYKTVVYAQDDDTQNPVKMVFPDRDKQKWVELTEGPRHTDPVAFDEIFSFRQIPKTNSFLFVTRWDKYLVASGSAGQEIKTFYYDGKKSGEKLFLLFSRTAMKNKAEPDFTKIGSISSDGKYVAFNNFTCWGCPPEVPETSLYNLTNGKQKGIGKVGYFVWLKNGEYEYKDYQPCEDTQESCTDIIENQPMKRGKME